MEQLNRIEVRGNVGSIRLQPVGDRLAARFTVATNYAYKDKDGGAVIETTWHNVSAWQGKNMIDLHNIQKGSKVYVQGRMHSQKFQGMDGQDHTVNEIVARNIIILDEEVDALQCEF